MTWSIIAREPETGVMGLALATRFFAAGALVPHTAHDAGIVATQALVNPTYGARGLAMLRGWMAPARAFVYQLRDTLVTPGPRSATKFSVVCSSIAVQL